MSPVVTEAELVDDLFDLDLKIALDPIDRPGGSHLMAHTNLTGCLPPGPTVASSCNSYGQTGHPCRCF